jgi:hypothetical protein
MEGRTVSIKNSGENSLINPSFFSQAEREVADALKQFPSHINVEQEGAPIQIPRGDDEPLRYRPDFVLRDGLSGKTLVIEVKSLGSMSLANLVKLRMIQDFLKSKGVDFVLLVFGVANEEFSSNPHFNMHGVNALGFVDFESITQKIVKRLE